MAVQLVALVWYISGLVHDLEHLKQTVSAQDELIRLIDQDVDDLWAFCTFTVKINGQKRTQAIWFMNGYAVQKKWSNK